MPHLDVGVVSAFGRLELIQKRHFFLVYFLLNNIVECFLFFLIRTQKFVYCGFVLFIQRLKNVLKKSIRI